MQVNRSSMLQGVAVAVMASCLAVWAGSPPAPVRSGAAPASQRAPESAAPATSPAAGFPIRGRIAIALNWTLQRPDLTRTVVYLSSAPVLDAIGAPKQPVIMAQHEKAFQPNFVVISLGTTMEFPNWDRFDHNVFSRSKAAPAFDLARYPYGQSKSRTFDKLGVVQVFCNIHPGMRGMILVVPNTFFCRADPAGNFELPRVPPGDYELVVWNERCKEQRQKVVVNAGGAPQLSLVLQEDRGAIMANDPPEPKDGYSVERGLSVKREKLNLPVVEECHDSPVPPPAK